MSQTAVTHTLPLKPAHVPVRDRALIRAPGRPINLGLKDNILAAIAQVLAEEGYQGLTISRVAKAAGVSTATVYRRWPTKQAMFFDAIRLWRDDLTPQIDTGSFAGDVDELIAARIRFLATPLGRTYGTLLGEAVHDPEFGQVLWEVSVVPARAQMALFLERASKRGEKVFCQHADTVLDMLLSTTFPRHEHAGARAHGRAEQSAGNPVARAVSDFLLTGQAPYQKPYEIRPPMKRGGPGI